MIDILRHSGELLVRARRVVVFTGAGISAESGIATFRDAQDGLWMGVNPSTVASQNGFSEDPGLVWRWYMHRLADITRVEPNPGHIAIVDLFALVRRAVGHSFTLVTQNIDDLHERAGSPQVLHLHGSLARFRCNRCRSIHHLQDMDRSASLPPSCLLCGEFVRPDVVWFGETLPGQTFAEATAAARRCDLMLVVGTSGLVYPANELPFIAHASGATVIDVNPEPTEFSRVARVYLQGRAGTVLPALLEETRLLTENPQT
jgi:NAD-dependent deacetylase